MAKVWLLLTAAVALSACAQYGYVYTYDPYLGPRGQYVTLTGGPSPATAYDCSRLVYAGPHEDGYRGAYLDGPYCAPAAAHYGGPPLR